MKVKTNFKKMFLVDNLPMNNENAINDNNILNKFIESIEGDKSITINDNKKEDVLDEGNKVDNNEDNSQIINESVHDTNEINDEQYKFINKRNNDKNCHLSINLV